MTISLRSDDIVTTEGEHERCALGDQEHFCRWHGSPRHCATSDREHASGVPTQEHGNDRHGRDD
ncbi:MAG TPA: hypothetical protein DCQ80_09655 [Pseudomonas sp.]|nr:hypothetical protein [Pseudomonas sp.]